MNKKILLIICILLCESILNCAIAEPEIDNPLLRTSIFLEFEDSENFNLFISESVNLPGQIFPESIFNIRPYYLIFYFNQNLTKNQIDTLFQHHITAICEYSIIQEV